MGELKLLNVCKAKKKAAGWQAAAMALESFGCKLHGSEKKDWRFTELGMGILSWRTRKFKGACSGEKPLSAEHLDALIESFAMDSFDRSRGKFAASFDEVLDALGRAEALPASRSFADVLRPSACFGGWFAKRCAQLGDSRRKQMLPSYARALGRHLNANELLAAHGQLVEPAHPELGFELTRVLILAWMGSEAGGKLPRIFGHASAEGPRDPWSVCLARPCVFYTREECSQIASLLRRAAPAHEPKEGFWADIIAERQPSHAAAAPLEDRILGVLDAMPDRIKDPELGLKAVSLASPQLLGLERAGLLLDELGGRGMALDRAAIFAYFGELPMPFVDAFLARQERKALARDDDIRRPEVIRMVGGRL